MIIRRGCLMLPSGVLAVDDPSLAVRGYQDGKVVSAPLCRSIGGHLLVARYAISSKVDRSIEPQVVRDDGALSFGSGEVLTGQQRRVVSKCLDIMRHKDGCTMNVSCGGGKTVMALYMISKIKPVKTLILLDQRFLAEQWARRIMQFLPNATFSFVLPVVAQNAIFKRIGLDRRAIVKGDFSGNIVIATLQSFLALKRFSFDNTLSMPLVIADEAHIMSAPKFNGAVWRINYKWSLALTATVDRADGLEKVFLLSLGDDVVSMDVDTQIASVVLYGVKIPINDVDHVSKWCRSLRSTTTDYDCEHCHEMSCAGSSAGGVRRGKIFMTSLYRRLLQTPAYRAAVQDCVARLMRRGHHIIVFTKLVEHVKQLADEFSAVYGDDKVGVCCGGVKKAVAAIAFSRQITVCTYHIAQKGLDVPRKDAVVMALPLSDVRQAKGRIERFHPDKRVPLFVDIVVQGSAVLTAMALRRYRRYYAGICSVRFVGMSEHDLHGKSGVPMSKVDTHAVTIISGKAVK